MPKSEAKVETVEVKAVLHCKGCHKKFRKAIASIDEVDNVAYDKETKKYTLTGIFNREEVIKILNKTGKQIEVLKPKETNKKEAEKKEENKDGCKHDCCCCRHVGGYWRNDSNYCSNVYWKPDYCWCQSQKVCLLHQNRLTYGCYESNPTNCSFM
ncbi:hypothetical protein O6H91_02G032600 [Diphasiastrum complanatum]|uniref:Uncharacterized protein n=1 Tax=Diphasiastrum complanatum TaxID=34168 RepID=A0ACC2EE74_DIPCM|nr:hypothetical protein O6H91_02G032600 [Diphasiastrum complanatum]